MKITKSINISVMTIFFIVFAIFSIISWIPDYMVSKSQSDLCNTLRPDVFMNEPEIQWEQFETCTTAKGYFHNAQKISNLEMWLSIFIVAISLKIDNLKNKKS